MRSFLTTLGIIIGVAAVIAMVAIGEGAKAQVEASFASMGSNLLIVLPGTTTLGGQRGGFGSMPTLTWDDLKAIRTEVPAVRYAAAQLSSGAQLSPRTRTGARASTALPPEYFAIRNWPIAIGVADERLRRRERHQGRLPRQDGRGQALRPNANPVGQLVRIKNIPFEVKGVLATKGQSPTGPGLRRRGVHPAQDLPDQDPGRPAAVHLGRDLRSAPSRRPRRRARSSRSPTCCATATTSAPGQDDDFSIRNLTELASAQEEGTKTLTTLLASIAAVSLLVGGIGIMNIMLVSVTERTREIGVRMAVGAKPRNILAQFLVEALTLAIAGGLHRRRARRCWSAGCWPPSSTGRC